MRSAEIPKRTPDDPPPGTFTQDFNSNFLRTSNSGTARSELVNVSQNHGGESRRVSHNGCRPSSTILELDCRQSIPSQNSLEQPEKDGQTTVNCNFDEEDVE